jgi:hypothetical protein
VRPYLFGSEDHTSLHHKRFHTPGLKDIPSSLDDSAYRKAKEQMDLDCPQSTHDIDTDQFELPYPVYVISLSLLNLGFVPGGVPCGRVVQYCLLAGLKIIIGQGLGWRGFYCNTLFFLIFIIHSPLSIRYQSSIHNSPSIVRHTTHPVNLPLFFYPSSILVAHSSSSIFIHPSRILVRTYRPILWPSSY